MKNETTRNQFSLAKMYCFTFGHNFRTSKRITDHITEYQCSHCKEEVTVNANGLLEKLTPKFRETNAYLAKIHQRRHSRLLSKAS